MDSSQPLIAPGENIMQSEARVAGPIVIQADGTFDVPAAERVARELLEADGLEVRVDLTRVRDFHDFGVAVLARALAARREVSVRGLRTHQIRLLRYLGIEPAAEPARSADALV
jgi:NCAIR mutase (PurE)-related protein